MKKAVLLILFIFALVGCNQTSTGSNKYVRPKNYEGYASYLSITDTVMPQNQRLPQQFFSSTYTDITYTALTKELCVTANINDVEYRNATYYLVGRKKGLQTFGETRIQFLIPSGQGSKRVCFSNVDLSETYEILLTKDDRDDLNPSNTLYSVRTLTLLDTKAQKRNYITDLNVISLIPSTYSKTEDPYLLFSTSLVDAGKAIKKVYVTLFNPLDLVQIDIIIIDITNENYDDDILLLNDLRFDDLSPGLEYFIQIFADGNDGIDDFEKITIGNYKYETSSYEMSIINNSFHGLYAVVTDIIAVGDDVYIYYTYKNDETVLYTDTKETLELIYTTFTGKRPDQVVEETFPLSLSQSYIIIPKSKWIDGLYLSIRDTRFQYNFCDFYFPTTQRYIESRPAENNELSFFLFNLGGELPFHMKIDIIDSEMNILETLDISNVSYGINTFNLLGDYNKMDNYNMLITYKVNTYIGVIENSVELPLL